MRWSLNLIRPIKSETPKNQINKALNIDKKHFFQSTFVFGSRRNRAIRADAGVTFGCSGVDRDEMKKPGGGHGGTSGGAAGAGRECSQAATCTGRCESGEREWEKMRGRERKGKVMREERKPVVGFVDVHD